MCEWKPDFDNFNEHVTKIEGRVPPSASRRLSQTVTVVVGP